MSLTQDLCNQTDTRPVILACTSRGITIPVSILAPGDLRGHSLVSSLLDLYAVRHCSGRVYVWCWQVHPQISGTRGCYWVLMLPTSADHQFTRPVVLCLPSLGMCRFCPMPG